MDSIRMTFLYLFTVGYKSNSFGFADMGFTVVPRWTIAFYLDYLNDHYSPTHHDTFVTLFR